ncbi:hypothetical protein KUCAC02_000611 [Chaenocephalus aceratus]|uniref:Uncharacterized protein n=1 Tax=Chaenocephalus aceratus TaxID=36190 RepID=A0ACB9W651_CHAAC|nr:hypothetical protein KUCAC02_000611 [Chaenocephalus aceratus]
MMHLVGTCVLCFSLLMASPLVSANVSKSFKDCSHFFYMQSPPAGIKGTNLKRVCQKYADNLRYATLYDSSRHLPLYSAYIFKKSDGKRRMDTPWMYEPQLVSDDDSGNMRALPLTEDTPPLIEDSQAVLEDYTDASHYSQTSWTLPGTHTWTLSAAASTTSATGKSFIVTGVTLSGGTLQRDNRDRLGIPKYLWLAYCCPKFDRNSPYEVRFMFPSYGGYALNEQTDHSVVEVPLKTLESFLKSHIDNDLNIFYKGCVSENTFKKKRDLSSVSV